MAPDRAIGERIGTGRTAEVYALGADRVVKLLRPEMPDAAGPREATAAALVAAAVDAAPRFLGTTLIDGRPGLVYQRVDGPSMLDRLAAQPWSIGRRAAQLAALHAGIHAKDGSGLPDLKESLRGSIERDVDLPRPMREASLRRVAALPDGHAICHGDMHPGNVLLSASGPVVIDWVQARAGPAAADVARTLFLLRDSAIPAETPYLRRGLMSVIRSWFADLYLARYRRLTKADDRIVALWRLPVLAARLAEAVPGERDRLLSLIEREARAGADAA